MPTESEIRNNLRAVMGGEMTIGELNLWIMTETIDPGRDALPLAGAVALACAEYTGGYLTEADLLAQLSTLASNVSRMASSLGSSSSRAAPAPIEPLETGTFENDVRSGSRSSSSRSATWT